MPEEPFSQGRALRRIAKCSLILIGVVVFLAFLMYHNRSVLYVFRQSLEEKDSDTQLAPGFSRYRFAEIQKGDTLDSVLEKLGTPLDIAPGFGTFNWIYENTAVPTLVE